MSGVVRTRVMRAVSEGEADQLVGSLAELTELVAEAATTLDLPESTVSAEVRQDTIDRARLAGSSTAESADLSEQPETPDPLTA